MPDSHPDSSTAQPEAAATDPPESEGSLGRELINRYNGVGCLLGIGAGTWAATTPRIADEETTVLLAAAGAAVGVLAVTVTVMTLVIAFIEGPFGQVIADYGIDEFFSPFVVIVAVSAVDAIVCFAGALDSGGGDTTARVGKSTVVTSTGVGPPWTRDALFGIAAWLLVWAIAGVLKLVRSLVTYARQRAKVLDAYPVMPNPTAEPPTHK